MKAIKKAQRNRWSDSALSLTMLVFISSLLIRNDIYYNYFNLFNNKVNEFIGNERASNNETNLAINVTSIISNFKDVGNVYAIYGVIATIYMAIIAIVLGGDIKKRAEAKYKRDEKLNKNAYLPVKKSLITFQNLLERKHRLDLEIEIYRRATFIAVILSVAAASFYICQPINFPPSLPHWFAAAVTLTARAVLVLPIPLIFSFLSSAFNSSLSEISEVHLGPNLHENELNAGLNRFEFLRVALNSARIPLQNTADFDRFLLKDAEYFRQIVENATGLIGSREHLFWKVGRRIAPVFAILLTLSVAIAVQERSLKVFYVLVVLAIVLSLIYVLLVYFFINCYLFVKRSSRYTPLLLTSLSAFLIYLLLCIVTIYNANSLAQYELVAILLFPGMMAIMASWKGVSRFHDMISNLLAENIKYFSRAFVSSLQAGSENVNGQYSAFIESARKKDKGLATLFLVRRLFLEC